MYQKQEIIVKKNAELIARFAEVAGENESGVKNGEIVLHCKRF